MKSLEELKQIRVKALKNVDIRRSEEVNGIKLLIGMGTCGIASGARETLNAMIDEIQKQDLHNVFIVQTGCMGHCHAEPMIQISVPGHDPITYGHVTAEKGREIINRHIMKGELIEELLFTKTFHRI